MPGPLPKPAGHRRRRNSSHVVRLPAEPGGEVPKLPGAGKLLGSTREWWAGVWRSPMAAVYLDADVPALVRLAGLIDVASRGEATAALLGEIRQMEDRYGLSPMARRRLQWEVEQAQAAGVVPLRSVSSAQRERLERRRVFAVDPSSDS